MAAIEEGVKASGNPNYRMLPDRRDAIRRAVAVAGPEWALLVAGKGNEDGQEIAGVKLPFSDRDELVQALDERAEAEGRPSSGREGGREGGQNGNAGNGRGAANGRGPAGGGGTQESRSAAHGG
jgi:hypothetical protein